MPDALETRKSTAQSGAEGLFEGESETPSAPPTQDEKILALLAHVGGAFGFLVPLVLYLVKRGQSRFVEDQAKEALNFQITMTLAAIAAGLAIFIIVGIALVPLVFLYNLVGCTLGAIAVNKGKMFRYRFCLRLIK